MPAPIQPRPEAPLELNEANRAQARIAIVQRLSELVSWPESRSPAYERHLAADILVGLLRTSGVELRRRCADGLIRINDAPKALLRYLARDEIKVAGGLIETGLG